MTEIFELRATIQFVGKDRNIPPIRRGNVAPVIQFSGIMLDETRIKDFQHMEIVTMTPLQVMQTLAGLTNLYAELDRKQACKSITSHARKLSNAFNFVSNVMEISNLNFHLTHKVMFHWVKINE